MTTPTIEYSKQNGIGVLLVRRPRAHNALNWAAQREFAAAVAACAEDADLRTLIITGSGDTFIAGGDIKDQIDRPDEATGRALASGMGAALQQLTALPAPVIAAVNGHAYGGGCEILTACDLRVMRANARLHFVQARLGLTTGWGGAARLVRLVGLGQALDLLLTARAVTAAEALAMGLVQRVVPVEDDVLAAAHNLAEQIAALPANAVAALKALLYEVDDLPLTAGYAAETRRFLEAWSHPNHAEAVAAFVGKRPPRFT